MLLGLLGGVLNFLTLIGAALLVWGINTARRKNARENLSNRRLERMLSAKVPDIPMRFTFEEDCFFVTESGRDSSYRYHVLTDVWEDEERYYLFLQGKMQYILQKDAFFQGTPDSFRPFIREKAEIPVPSK